MTLASWQKAPITLLSPLIDLQILSPERISQTVVLTRLNISAPPQNWNRRVRKAHAGCSVSLGIRLIWR